MTGVSPAGTTPTSGAGGLFRGPNLPYSLTTFVALGVLIGFVVVTRPFAGADAGSTTAPTVATGDPAAGETMFSNRCSVCHGPGGEGIVGLGKPLTTSEFVGGLTDQQLFDFLLIGRSSDDPLNTTGVAMPARGGVPPLTDSELSDVIAYLRTLGGA